MSKSTALAPSITRRLITCTQSRSVGKSTIAELLISWLNRNDIAFGALDADRLNQTLARRYPNNVRFHEAAKSESDFLRFLRAIPDLPVTIVDFPSNSTDLILAYAEHYGLAEYLEKAGIRPTFLIFAADDRALKVSGSDTVHFFKEKADYVLIENPAKFESEVFKKLPLYKWLIEHKTPTVHMPVIATPTIEAWESLEHKNKQYLSLEQACNSAELHDLSRAELQYFRDQVLLHFNRIAGLLLPDVALLKHAAPVAPIRSCEKMDLLHDPFLAI